MRKKRSLLKNIAIVVFITALLSILAVFFLGRTGTVRYFLRNINERSPLNVELAYFNWNLLTSRIEIRDLYIIHRENKKEAKAQSIEIRYRPWDILRGKLFVKSLKISGVDLNLPKAEKKKKKIPGIFDVTKLFFLQNIIVREGLISSINIKFPGEVVLNIDELRIGLRRNIFHQTALTLNLAGSRVTREQKMIAEIASLTLKASTNIPRWRNEFPYFNDLAGQLKIYDSHLEKMPVDSLTAKLSYLDNRLKLDPFEVVIGGKALNGSLKADTSDETWEVKFDIPRPISLPYIGKEMLTLDTAGELSGMIEAKGEGFIPSQSSGNGQVSLAHRFAISPQRPVRVSAKAFWKNGVINIEDGLVMIENDAIKTDGTIDIVKKHIRLNGQAKGFQAEDLFGKFRNEKFHRIFGKSDVTAYFSGWGKKFEANIKVVTFDGGYDPMVAQIVESDIKATYDRLSIDWKIIQNEKNTGRANLVVNFGNKMDDGSRYKDIDLKVDVADHPLVSLFPEWGLKGNASGNLVLSGPHMNFHGNADIKVVEGGWFAASFDRAQANLDISRKQILLKDMQINLPKIDPIVFSKPIVMDLAEGSMRIHGDPTPRLKMDIAYYYDSKKWQIKELTYVDSDQTGRLLNLTGSMVTGGALNLSAKGSVDLAALIPLGFLVRDASGPVTLDLNASGPAANPSVHGKMKLEDCIFSPRFIRLPLENAKGDIKFEGHKIFFENMTGMVDDGTFALKGSIEHSNFKIVSANLALEGKDLIFRTDDNSFRAEFNGELTLSGRFPSPMLAGDLTILDGKYSKDFNLLEAMTGKKKKTRETAAKDITFDPSLNLRIRNSGDLFIRNNVGDIGLRADLNIKGTRKKPVMGGAVEATEGRVHYMGMEFDITRGFVEFRENIKNPYLEVVAQKEINIYNVTVEVHGDIDNLSLDLSATSPSGPLEKRDIISLLAFGMTEAEREEIAAQGGEQFGVAMAAQQLTHVIERPVKEFAHLDTFRLEAADPTSQSISRIAVGKRFSDRLSVNFTTDINTKDAVQTFVAEYLFTDNLLLKGSRSTDGRYEMSGVLRFRLR